MAVSGRFWGDYRKGPNRQGLCRRNGAEREGRGCSRRVCAVGTNAPNGVCTWSASRASVSPELLVILTSFFTNSNSSWFPELAKNLPMSWPVVFVHVYVHVCVSVCVHLCVCVCLCVHLCEHVCVAQGKGIRMSLYRCSRFCGLFLS